MLIRKKYTVIIIEIKDVCVLQYTGILVPEGNRLSQHFPNLSPKPVSLGLGYDSGF